jgi:ribosome-binding factor A
MSSVRIQKVAELIRHELSEILRDDVDEVRQALVTITSVWLSADMRLARVHVSIFPDSANRTGILAALRRGRGRLKRDLGRALRLRHVPDLEFKLDTSLEQGARIEELLKADGPREDDEAPPAEGEPD